MDLIQERFVIAASVLCNLLRRSSLEEFMTFHRKDIQNLQQKHPERKYLYLKLLCLIFVENKSCVCFIFLFILVVEYLQVDSAK